MSTLAEVTAGCRTWAVTFPGGGDPVVGPVDLLGARCLPDVTVALVPRERVPSGVHTGSVDVWESARGGFAVEQHDFDGAQGVHNPSGGNWVLWDNDRAEVAVTASGDSDRDWVHVRFVLRHFVVSRLVDRAGFAAIHAVAGPVPPDGGGLVIAGPTLSGKTFLYERLVDAGLVGTMLEDDCVVVDPDGVVVCCIPQRDDVVAARRLRVAAVVCLREGLAAPIAVSAAETTRWMAQVPASWPAPWLPGGSDRAVDVPNIRDGVRMLQVPTRDADVAVPAVRSLLAGVSNAR